MHRLLLTVSFYLTGFFLQAQTGEAIIAELQSINHSVTHRTAGTDSAAAISNRAMNVFLADKTGYLSTSTDLSFYTNYATFSTADGKFTVNHNFQKATGTDEPIKKLFSIGFDMTIAGSYAKSFLDNRFENELGVSINYTWLGKVKTRFEKSGSAQNNNNQKQAMDALRAALLQSLVVEIKKKEADFKLAMEAIDSGAIPGQDIATAKIAMQRNFNEDLQSAYEEKFATLQAALLTKTGDFRLISTNWTSFTAYVPLLFPKYTVAPSLVTSFNEKHPYPFKVMINHTRLWESAHAGRLFFTLNGTLLFNNSKLSYGLSKLNYSEYKNLGGTDTTQTADPGNNKLYIGNYKAFVTPSLSARLVYFPPASHVGFSVLAEQGFNEYNLLNCKLGVPIILINSKKTPAVNIECYMLLLDLTGKVNTAGKTSIGLSLGIPFSRLMY
jgi:hypothetical protein